MDIQIKHRYTGKILFETEAKDLRKAVEESIRARADLKGADLKGAVLTGAVLTGVDLTGAVLTGVDLTGVDLTGAVLTVADLTGADLTGAVLTGADLTGADLTGVDLTGVDLTGAVLTGADLTGVDLTGADLTGADLTGVVLTGAVLTGADLTGADLTGAVLRVADLKGVVLTGAVLTPIRDDLWAVLSAAPAEVDGIRKAVVGGEIDGSVYEGECACLVGTIAKLQHCKYTSIKNLEPNGSRPIERFFMGINKGDTPDTNPVSKIVVEWIDQWLLNMRAAFGEPVAAQGGGA